MNMISNDYKGLNTYFNIIYALKLIEKIIKYTLQVKLQNQTIPLVLAYANKT